jgi:hypothetical protein
MAFGSITLEPGVNVERTPMLLRAGVSKSNLIRYRDGLIQKMGGWQRFYPFNVQGTPRDLHAWEDLNQATHLEVGTTTQLAVISANNAFQDITPQTLISNFAPNISTTNGSNVVTIIDPNITNVTVYDAVFFNVPVSIGGLILDGLYQIASVTGTHSYTILAPINATSTAANSTATNGATAIGNNTLHFASDPVGIGDGYLLYDLTAPAAIPTDTTVTAFPPGTVTMSNNAAAPGVGNGDLITFASLPIFTTINGNSIVSVNLINNGVFAGDTVVFAIPTTGMASQSAAATKCCR